MLTMSEVGVEDFIVLLNKLLLNQKYFPTCRIYLLTHFKIYIERILVNLEILIERMMYLYLWNKPTHYLL